MKSEFEEELEREGFKSLQTDSGVAYKRDGFYVIYNPNTTEAYIFNYEYDSINITFSKTNKGTAKEISWLVPLKRCPEE